MKNQYTGNDQDGLAKVASELQIIRKLLTALLLGVAVLIVALFDAEAAIVLAIVALFLWLLLLICAALLHRAQRRRHESMRCQELSGRTKPLSQQ